MNQQGYPQNQYSATPDDGFQKIGSDSTDTSNRGGKWRFEDPGKHFLEGVLVRKVFGHKGKYGISNFYVVKSATDNMEYVVGGTALLDDRMKQIPDGSFVRIIYQGRHQEKNYKMFEVYVNRNYNPNSYVAQAPQQPQYQQPTSPAPQQPQYQPPVPQQPQYQPPVPQQPQQPQQPPQQWQASPQPPAPSSPFGNVTPFSGGQAGQQQEGYTAPPF